MGKTIVLVRHAKSSWSDPELKDHWRPLNEKGYHDAPLIARYLQEKDLSPDLIVSSTAVRAYSTAIIFSEMFSCLASLILLRSDLYESSVSDYLEVCRQLDDSANTVFLFGHNPTISAFSHFLAGVPTEAFSTCAAGIHTFSGKSWANLNPGTAPMSFYIKPKMLK